MHVTFVPIDIESLRADPNMRSVRLACQPTNQQYCSLILNQHQSVATNQSAVLLSHIQISTSHNQINTAIR
jgi:hypothetical protein